MHTHTTVTASRPHPFPFCLFAYRFAPPGPVYHAPAGYASADAAPPQPVYQIPMEQPVYQIPMEASGGGGGEVYLEVRGTEPGVYGVLAPAAARPISIVAENTYNRLSGAGVPDLVAGQPMYSVLVAAPAGAGESVYDPLNQGKPNQGNDVVLNENPADSSTYETTGSTA